MRLFSLVASIVPALATLLGRAMEHLARNSLGPAHVRRGKLLLRQLKNRAQSLWERKRWVRVLLRFLVGFFAFFGFILWLSPGPGGIFPRMNHVTVFVYQFIWTPRSISVGKKGVFLPDATNMHRDKMRRYKSYREKKHRQVIDREMDYEWRHYKAYYHQKHGREPPLSLRKLAFHPRRCLQDSFPLHIYDRIQHDLKGWRHLKNELGRKALQEAAERYWERPTQQIVVERVKHKGKLGTLVLDAERSAGRQPRYWMLWGSVKRLLRDTAAVLPEGVKFGFEWGDGMIGLNEIGDPQDVFVPMQEGSMAFAMEHTASSKFALTHDPHMDKTVSYLKKACLLSDTQIKDHILRHGNFQGPQEHRLNRGMLLGLSQSKVDGCSTDILFPTPYWVSMVRPLGFPGKAWDRRKKAPVVFRGTSTGADYQYIEENGSDWRNVHRARLALMMSKSELVDAKLTKVSQTGRGRAGRERRKRMIRELRREGALGNPVPNDYANYHQYVLDVDGNGWSARLPTLLWGGALVFRAGIYSNFMDGGFLRPFEHYVPVRLDFSDLEERIEWAVSNPAKVQEILANVKRDFPQNEHMMYKHIACYGTHVLLEYACLVHDECIDEHPMGQEKWHG